MLFICHYKTAENEMKKNNRIAIAVIVCIIALVINYCRNQKNTTVNSTSTEVEISDPQSVATEPKNATHTIDELTEENRVIAFVKENNQLPDCYLTKSEAKGLGWIPSKGNLCEVAPNKAIGGDRFGNREKKLPLGTTYYEADVNYHCGRRQSDRIVFTKEGEVWLTKDHYQTFQKK